jgi:phosphatidylserine/phosphatidylglycerophosphate/cardiolipin synthase-like enzyme
VFTRGLEQECQDLTGLLLAGLLLAAPIQVLETAPLETELDSRDIRNAIDVLPGLIAEADSSIDLAQFYLLYYEPDSRGAILFSLYDALIAAARRGVTVRVLLDSTILEQNRGRLYSRMRDSLSRVPGIAVRASDLRPLSRTRECQMHAKYLVIDSRVSVIGSHNWSYSAFCDNRELSLLIRDTAIARDLTLVFETDWRVAARDSTEHAAVRPSERQSTALPALVVTSPHDLSDSSRLSTISALKRLFSSARSSIDLAVNSITLRTDFGSAPRYGFIDSLIRDAARREVRVRLLVDRWSADREPRLLRTLNNIDHVQVRVIDIADIGPNPRTGTAHAKLVIADRAHALVGSATLSQRQLLECRNVGLLTDDSHAVKTLQSVFDRDWNSQYTSQP